MASQHQEDPCPICLEPLEPRILLASVSCASADAPPECPGSSDLITVQGEEDISIDSVEMEAEGMQSDWIINIDDLRADPNFAGINGAGYSIVIIDTGIDLNHPFFGPDNDHNGVSDRIVYHYDFVSDPYDGSDTYGHGSNVASIAASSDSTWTGVAPGVNIISLKVFPDGNNTSAQGQDISEALQWVTQHVADYNIVSVNLSLGSGNYSTPTIWGPEFATLAGLNVISVASSGNQYASYYSSQGVASIAADPNVLAVGAVYSANVGAFSLGYGDQAYSTAPDRITGNLGTQY